MKKLLFLTIFIQSGLLYSQNSMVLDFNQDNLVPNTNTFKCEGSFTYFTISTNPIDTLYYVTLKKGNIILEQGNYSSVNSQSAGLVVLDSLIYAGHYELTVVSLSSNVVFSDTFSFYDPWPLYFDYATDNLQLCDSFGNIYINNISGGTPPYSFGQVNAQGEFTPIYAQNLIDTNYIIEDLSSGFYTVSLEDSFGCIYTVGSDIPIEIEQAPDPINIISTHQEDSFSICVQGGIAPIYFVLNEDTIVTNDSCQSYALCAGDYNLIVLDDLGDSLCFDTLDFNIAEIDGYIDQQSSTMNVEFGGVQPFSYSWSKNGEIQVNQTDSIFEGGLCPGSYTCTIIDQAYCSSSFDLTINEIISDLIEEIDCFDQDFSSLETSVSGGTSPYEYLWNTNETTSSINNLSPQTYQLTITDNNDCQLIEEIEVPVVLDSCLFNAFSPNGDNINDTWLVNTSFLYENTEVVIYNRWGAKVYQSLGYKQAWDGRNSAGDLVKEGVYFYSIILKNGHEKIKGSVSVFY